MKLRPVLTPHVTLRSILRLDVFLKLSVISFSLTIS
jgi:hypothetical protein